MAPNNFSLLKTAETEYQPTVLETGEAEEVEEMEEEKEVNVQLTQEEDSQDEGS